MTMNNTFTQYIKGQYDLAELKEVYEHGCASGCISGLIYYRETNDIYSRFKDQIWEILQETADQMGFDNVIELLASNDKASLDTPQTFENHMVWFAVEIIAGQLVQEQEQMEE